MARRSLSKDTALVRQRLDGHPIVLVGLMGAGKTTVGRRLAEKLGLTFVDADHEIEVAAGQTIPEIFAKHGEAYFRDGERKVIARLLENGAQVLATGGGAYMNADTRNAIRTHGISIWLRADFDLLMRRVRRRSNRPLLQNDDPEGVMRKLIADRYPVYAEADITVDSRDVAHTSIVNTIIKTLARWPGWDRLTNEQR
ncbi:shikimate kinase [Taklimakanibacter albus]|uniref:Shikimate kinase n=1 Tax=Taklimakanibacter albus TaxID=2800327 RepID=A0ACC5R6B7_9HYPH|nr:shikimate kinase [Aestuariivirga sp. YIM B02566]MBK1868168.1 shikimate kinase [Aestuariivirga sp. YIM B02566]